jgi:hypothetical protein
VLSLSRTLILVSSGLLPPLTGRNAPFIPLDESQGLSGAEFGKRDAHDVCNLRQATSRERADGAAPLAYLIMLNRFALPSVPGTPYPIPTLQ